MACKLIYLPHQKLYRREFVYAAYLKAQFSDNADKRNKPDDSTEVTKESLQWRSPWAETKGEWYSKLKIFASDHNNTDIIKFLQSPIDLRPSTIKKWYARNMEETEIQMQQYIPERNKILGDNLAAAHFIVYRGGKVKFHNDFNWIIQKESEEVKLPCKYVPHMKVQAIDCSNVKLYYEGLANFHGLEQLEWLCLRNCSAMDDWCMDRISGMFKDSLLYLDIRNCNNITYRGIGSLYRAKKLKTLLIDNVKQTKELELTCLMLQELNPNLQIKNQE